MPEHQGLLLRAGSRLDLTVTGYLVFGASPPVTRFIYALAKNSMLWRFCLRRARGLRLASLAFVSLPPRCTVKYKTEVSDDTSVLYMARWK